MLAAMRRISLPIIAITVPLLLACACKKSAETAGAAPPSVQPSLDKPKTLNQHASDVYRARFATSKGDFVIEVQRDWAPQGADRFFNLVKNGYFNDTRFFRVIKNFMVQWGIHGQGEVNAIWRDANIPDDPVKQSNKRGFITFATAGPNTRTTQVFINYADNGQLDGMGFAPFGKVTSGMDVVDGLFGGYGEGAPQGRGPNQGRMQSEGNAYLARDFPNLDYIIEASIVR